MSKLSKHISTTHNSFYAQKMANSFSPDSRARNSKDSLVYKILNTFAFYIEDTYRYLRKNRLNMYVATYDAFDDGVLYSCNIPRKFLFEYEQLDNRIIYYAPQVVASDGDTSFTLEVVDDLEELYRAKPTRISLSNVNYSVTDIVENTVVSDLSSATINDIPISNWIYVTLSNGTNYGTTDNKSFFYPASITLTGLTSKDTVESEGSIFYSDDIIKTWKRFADLEEIEVENVDSSTMVKIDSWGFNRDYILERTYSYSRKSDRTPLSLYYAIGDDEEATGSRTKLKYQVRETNTIQLQRQGYASLVEEFGLYLVDEDSNHVVLNDITKMEMSEWLFATDDNNLYLYDVFIPSITSEKVLAELKTRTIDPHLALDMTPLPTDLLEINKSYTFATHNKYPLSQFGKPVRVRLYVVDENGSKTYYDKSGSSVSAADAWRYNELRNRGTTKWNEKKWSLSFSSLGSYAVVLETDFLNRNQHPVDNINNTITEYDVINLQVGYKTPLKQFAWPDSIQPVKGITFDHDSNLWARSTSSGNKAHKINLHFDQCLIDYEAYRLYTKENYNEISSIENTQSRSSINFV